MNRKLHWAWIGAAAIAFSACGAAGGPEQGGGAASGDIQVTVHDLTEAEVAKVVLELEPKAGTPAGTLRFTLLATDPERSRLPGPPVRWEYTRGGIPVGTYEVSAGAFVDPDADPLVDTPLFRSNSIEVEVIPSAAAPAHLFLFQESAGAAIEVPFFTSIQFSHQPVLSELIMITVQGSGGVGDLELSGSGADGSFGASTGLANLAPGAAIEWTAGPPPAGEQRITLSLEDGVGNRASAVLAFFVDHARGAVDFDIDFNHAPTAAVALDLKHGASEVEVAFSVTYVDVDAPGPPWSDIEYNWDFADCTLEGFSQDPSNPNAQGDALADGASAQVFKLRRTPPAQLPEANPVACQVELEVKDKAVSPASRSYLFQIGTQVLEYATP